MKAGVPLFTVSFLTFPPVIFEGLRFLFSLICLHLSFITAIKVGGKQWSRPTQSKSSRFSKQGIKCHLFPPLKLTSLTHPPRRYINITYPSAHTQILTALIGQTFQDGSERQAIHPGCDSYLLCLWLVHLGSWITCSGKTLPVFCNQKWCHCCFKRLKQRYNPDTHYADDLQILSPHHFSTRHQIFWKILSEKKGQKKKKESRQQFRRMQPTELLPFP